MNHPLPSTTSPASPSVSASPRRRRLSAGLAALAVAGIALSGCAPAVSPADVDSVASARDLLAAHDLVGLDVGEVIERLDAMPVADRPDDLLASVEPDALLLRDTTGRESRLPMPDDAVYISVAPFREQTHECHFHSLTTCLGELRNAPVHVKVTGADGQVLVDADKTTYDNGFVAVWLPRDISATLTITRDGKTATQPISTGPQDATCITTAQLA